MERDHLCRLVVELTEFGFPEKLWDEKRRVLGSVVVVKKLAQRRRSSHFFPTPSLRHRKMVSLYSLATGWKSFCTRTRIPKKTVNIVFIFSLSCHTFCGRGDDLDFHCEY